MSIKYVRNFVLKRAFPIADNHDDDESEDDSESSTGDKDLSPGPFFVPSPSDVHQRVEDDGVKESTPHREHHHHRHHHHHHRHDHYPANKRPAMYPAALKIALRNHIRTLCGTPHCVDSFVVYLSSPTRTSDGASLLWDADHNGVVCLPCLRLRYRLDGAVIFLSSVPGSLTRQRSTLYANSFGISKTVLPDRWLY